MLARWSHVAPALVRARPSASNRICSFLSVCTTETPAVSGRLSEPLAPLMVTASAAMVAVTPAGSSTGALAILDMTLSHSLRRRCTGLPALPDRARLAVGHHAFGGGGDHRGHCAEGLGQLILAAVDPQPRGAGAVGAIGQRP